MTGWQDDKTTAWQKLPNVAKKMSNMVKSPRVDIRRQTLLNVVINCHILQQIDKSCQKLPKLTKSWQLDMMPWWYKWWSDDMMTQSHKHGHPLQPNLPPTCMTHVPSTMIKMTTDFVEIASSSSVTYHCQIMVVHCSLNCHLLVWPIYQAQWSKWQQILLKQHHYPV